MQTAKALMQQTRDAAGSLRGQSDWTDDETAAANLTTTLTWKWCDENQPEAERVPRACRRYVRANVRRLKQEACGFAFLSLLISAVLSWIIERCLDAGYETWKKNRVQVRYALMNCSTMRQLCEAAKEPTGEDTELE